MTFSTSHAYRQGFWILRRLILRWDSKVQQSLLSRTSWRLKIREICCSSTWKFRTLRIRARTKTTQHSLVVLTWTSYLLTHSTCKRQTLMKIAIFIDQVSEIKMYYLHPVWRRNSMIQIHHQYEPLLNQSQVVDVYRRPNREWTPITGWLWEASESTLWHWSRGIQGTLLLSIRKEYHVWRTALLRCYQLLASIIQQAGRHSSWQLSSIRQMCERPLKAFFLKTLLESNV